MLSTETQLYHWQFDHHELADPDLVDRLILSLCDSCGIEYPHFKLQLLISELMTNAIDHGVLSLKSHVKDSDNGFEEYLIERARRLREFSGGSVSVTAEWVGRGLLRITVADSGEGFDFSACRYSSDLIDIEGSPKVHGRGLAIIKRLCESVVHHGRGNCIVVELDVSATERVLTESS